MRVLTLLLIPLAIAAHGEVAHKRNFASSLFMQFAPKHLNESVVICPLSVRSSLAMFLVNSEGKTKRELLAGLHLRDLPKRKLMVGFQALQKRLSGAIKFNIGNRLYLNNDTRILQSAIKLSSKFLATDAVTTFFGAIQATKTTIGEWVSKVSDNTIKSTVDLETQPEQQHGELVSVATFKARWEKPFPVDATTKHNFMVNATSSVEVDMMSQENVFSYAESPVLDAKIVALPLVQSSITMLLILPNRVDGLHRLECKLKRVNIQKVAHILERKFIRLTLPRFKLVTNAKLRDSLRHMGIRSLFENPQIVGLTDDNRNVLTEVVHKVAFEIDESGGTARSKADVAQQSPPQEPVANFTADHPFVFYVRDVKTIFFVGHIANF